MEKKISFEKKTTPLMGWSSWNSLGVGVNREGVLAQIDAMVETGLADAGYEYINIDDCWMGGRDTITGRVLTDKVKFPNGMKEIADYAHSRGLKAGIYTDAGDNTCESSSGRRLNGRQVGLYRHEEDLWQYLSDGVYRDKYARENPDDPGVECWGYDFIKIDWCGGRDHNLDKETTYTKYDKIINEIEQQTGKDKIHNLCCWGYWGPWMLRVGDYWRAGGDIFANFNSILECIDTMKKFGRFTVPGHYADADMLEVGNGLTLAENRSHFAMWCMFSNPLVLGNDLRKISRDVIDIVTNRELIELDADPLARCAHPVKTIGENVEVWFKKLVDPDSGDGAVALLNRGNKEETVTFDFADICVSGEVEMRDLCKHEDLGEAKQITVTIPAHDIVVLKIRTDEGYVNDNFAVYTEDEIEIPRDNPEVICATTAKYYMDSFDALLIDVRTQEEYNEYHLPGAINVPYTRLIAATDVIPMEKDTHIIVYCMGEKRSAQAFHELKRLGYDNTYILNKTDNFRSLFDIK